MRRLILNRATKFPDLRKHRLGVAIAVGLLAGAIAGAAPLHTESAPVPFPAVIALSTLNGSSGFRMDGSAANEDSGSAVAKAGDVNGDHIDDFIIGAPGAANGAGRAYVVFGRSQGFSSTLDLATLSGSNGFRIESAALESVGISVGGGGDINGDGFDDIVVGTSGGAYVVFGHSVPFAAALDVSTLDGSSGFAITSETGYDSAGASIAIAGDMNGDGFDDVVIGAPLAQLGDDLYAGSAFVVLGHGGTFASSVSLASIDGSNGFRLDGVEAGAYLGHCVARAGDVNGDGFDDIIVGAHYSSPGGISGAGSSYIVFGRSGAFASPLTTGSLNGSNGFRLAGATASTHSGASVAGAGDINGDGFDDVVVGQPLTKRQPPPADYSGRSYVVFGHGGSFASSMSLSSINGTNGFRLDGAADSYSGEAVSAAGDVNGDGVADIMIGAYQANSYTGSAYVVFGHTGTYPASINLTSLDGSDGFRMDGVAANDKAGHAIAGVGDVDGDGGDDVLVGAFGADPHAVTFAGSSYIVFGHSDRIFASSFEAP